MGTVVAPKIHIGGTSSTDLIAGYEKARVALLVALQRLSDTWPHARDYVGDAQAWDAAVQQHKSRMDRVNDVAAELEALWRSVAEQHEQGRKR